MSEQLLDRVGRRQSAATLPGFHAGGPPRNRRPHLPRCVAIAPRSLRLLDQQGDLPRDDLSVGLTLDAHRDVPPRCWNNDLIEVAVRHDHMPKAATIELAALPRERQQRGVDQQLLEEIRARVGCIGDPVALCGLDALSLTARDIADLRPEIEDRLAERRVHLERIVRQH